MKYSGYHDQEKPAQRWALAVTILLHGLILGGLFSLIAWREPDPPLPQVGIELNLGFSDEGSGDIQPEPDQSEPQPEQSEPEPATPSEPEVEQQPVKTETVAAPEESPVAVQKKPEEKKKTPQKPEPQPPKLTPEEKKPDPKPDPKVTYDPNKTSDARKLDGSQGDSKNASGDKGDPKGSLDTKALYDGKSGGQTGSGGAGLDLAGWKWDREPKPRLSEQEKSGKIVFEIEVDADGQITKLVTLERGISLEAEKLCRTEIEKLNFIQVGATVPDFSKGKITIVVNAR